MKTIKIWRYVGFAAASFLAISALNSCKTGMPRGAVAVTNFDASKYLGKWYEIARFDFFFEKGLSNTTANYSLNSSGNIKVVNQGFNVAKGEWTKAEGEAKFVDARNVGRLKVSFFKPIWASYNVLSIDDNYSYALVAGDNLNYLWILSRTKTIPEQIKSKYLSLAKDLGYKTENLIWPKHDN